MTGIPSTSAYLYEPGSGLEVPGIEAVLEYGDASTYKNGAIPGALRINDRSRPDQVHVSELTGLHDSPDASDSRTDSATHWGERTGNIIPRGRTVGVTGSVRSNNVARMRDLWRRVRSQFGVAERDLIIHPPGEAPLYVNELWGTSTTSGWSAGQKTTSGTPTPIATFTDGVLAGVQYAVTGVSAAANELRIYPLSILDSAPALKIAWDGEDLWMTAVVRAPTASAAVPSIALAAQLYFYDDSVPGAVVRTLIGTWTAAGTGVIGSPSTGSYYLLYARMSASDLAITGSGRPTHVLPMVVMTTPAAGGNYTLRAARMAGVLLDRDDPSPTGYLGGDVPGFEYEGPITGSRSYGPCYTVNQVADVDSETSTGWANDSSSGAAVDVSGAVLYDQFGEGETAVSWVLRNPSTTSRTLALRSPATLAAPDLFVVAAGRSYRVHLRLLINRSYASATVSIAWLDQGGATIGSSSIGSFAPVASIPVVEELDGVVACPTGAINAYLRIVAATASTTSGDQLSLVIDRPRFYDVSEYDPGVVAIDSGQPVEQGVPTYLYAAAQAELVQSPAGARRRIPRPFLLRRVRALWDAKAPESQRNLLARRDFTMSLRASDPRIYVIDERHSQLRLSTTKKMVSTVMSDLSAEIDADTGATVAQDDFTGAANGSALSGRTAAVGGAWATSGDTVDANNKDFTINDTSSLGGPTTVQRTGLTGVTVGRFAILGSTSYTNVTARSYVGVAENASPSGGARVEPAVVARYVDNSNYLRAEINWLSGKWIYLRITAIVANSIFASISKALPVGVVGNPVYVELSAYASGHVSAVMTDAASGDVIAAIDSYVSALATGGALASGKVGIWDTNLGTYNHTTTFDNFVAWTPPVDLAGAFPGFTLEGASLDPQAMWKTHALGASYPHGGVALGAIENRSNAPPPSPYLSQTSLARMYYSDGALTYNTPVVTVAGSCIYGIGRDFNLWRDTLINGRWNYNYIGALLKRVSSTTWLEARFTSAHNQTMSFSHPSPAPPYSLELWSSHDASGAAVATRLGAWDISTTILRRGSVKYLRAYLRADNSVTVELWERPPGFTDGGLIARHLVSLSSALQALMGAGVAGRCGLSLRFDRWSDAVSGAQYGYDVPTIARNYGSPYVASFDATDNTSLMTCPVMGDADVVPLRVQLRGDVSYPTLTTTNIDSGESSTLRLSGVFSESDPVTIDMDAGTIVSQAGINYFDRRILGSRFGSLGPGQNVLTVQAVDWDANAPAHAIATWRDALK